MKLVTVIVSIAGAMLMALVSILVSMEWSETHALAKLTPGGWTLVAGMSGVVAIYSSAMLSGTLAGVAVGWFLGSRVADWSFAQEDERIVRQLRELEEKEILVQQERNNLSKRIEAARQEGVEIGREHVLSQHRDFIQTSIQLKKTEEHARTVEGKLKGAQSKARRLLRRSNKPTPNQSESSIENPIPPQHN